jgi:ketosteroid isomerase-like protein
MMTLLTLLVLPLLAQTPVPQSATPGRERDAAEIRAHIESIFQAFIEKDRKKLAETHGASWRGFTPWSAGVIRGRDGYMQQATFPEGVPKGQGMVGYRISDFDVVFYGDTAVASFVAELDVMNGTEKSLRTLTLLDVYHREPAGWIQVASNTSHHPAEMAREMARLRRLGDADRAAVLAVRASVWRAWFGGNTEALGSVLAPELITIDSRGEWGTLASTLRDSRASAASGAKLARLVFPRTEFQAYGATVILYTSYEMDLVRDGAMHTERGLATEVFVQQVDGRWLHTGWQLAPMAP